MSEPLDLNDPSMHLTAALNMGVDDFREGRRPMRGMDLMERLGFDEWRKGDTRYFRNAYGAGYRYMKWAKLLHGRSK